MITMTDAASLQIKRVLQDADENAHLHFGVTGRGCTGLSYMMNFSYDADISIIKDTVVDYKQNMLGGGFTIENPNAIASCGCGTSFRTKKRGWRTHRLLT